MVEEEEDEVTQAARLNSHAEASTSEAKVVLPSPIPNAMLSLCVTCHGARVGVKCVNTGDMLVWNR